MCIIFVFSFLLGIKALPREIENNAYVKFWGANKVHYGKRHHLINEKGTGAEMCPAIVSMIVTGNTKVSYWSVFVRL